MHDMRWSWQLSELSRRKQEQRFSPAFDLLAHGERLCSAGGKVVIGADWTIAIAVPECRLQEGLTDNSSGWLDPCTAHDRRCYCDPSNDIKCSRTRFGNRVLARQKSTDSSRRTWRDAN